MRIARFNLLRYGALSDRELIFRPDAAIHVVHGPNEAGKSTALAALSDLLFGFGQRKSHDFLHDGGALRVAATLEARDGRTLAFRRRRGNKNTLLADSEDERALPEDALAPFLGNLTRPVFERAFGLDSARLRLGSEEMLASGGELGAMLFAASSGILGVSDARKALEADAEKIFTPRKSGQRIFYQLLDRHEAARAQERSSELRASEWKRLNDDISRLEGEHEEKTRARAEVRQRRSEIETLRRLSPVLAEMDEEARQLAGFADIADLPDELGSRLGTALAETEQGRKAVEQAQGSVDRIRRDMVRIVAQPELAAALESVAEVFDRRGGVTKDQVDLPRVAAERDQFSARLAEMAARVGMDVARFEERQPTDAEIARIEEQLDGLADVERRIEELAGRMAEDEEVLRRLEEERPRMALVDPASWRGRLAALKPDLDRLDVIEVASAELAGRRRRLEERAARLDPPIPDLARLAHAPLPTRAETAERRDAIAAARTGVEAIEARLKSLYADIAERDRVTASADLSALPTPEAIAAARAARDTALSGLTGSEGQTLAAGELTRAIDGVKALTAAADTLVDAALRETERLGRLNSAREQRAVLASAAETAQAELAVARERLSELQAGYAALFSAAGVEAQSPDRMLHWLSEVAQLLELREEIETEAERIAAGARLADTLLQPLREIGEGIGLSGALGLPLSALRRAVDERLDVIQRGWEESRENAIQRSQCETRLQRFGTDRVAGEAERERLLAELRRLAPLLGLGELATPVEARAVIAVWKQVPALRLERENRDRRVRGMERDIARFEKDVGHLVARLAPDLGGQPAAQAIGTLNERAREAAAAATREREARAELVEAEAALASARQKQEESEAALKSLLGANVAPEEAPALAERLRARAELRVKLEACRNRFRQIAPDRSEEAVRETLRALDLVEADAELARLEAGEESLDGEINEVYAQLSARRAERTQLNQSQGAEAAVFERHAVEAEMVEAAREWVVLKLASLLLGEAMERQREASADPTLQRAGRIFGALTSGGFAGLAKRFDEQDAAELVALRENGAEVRLSGMSDGTVDQLHLALRLAYLADYCAANEPVPFIADDLFQTFDDARTAAALEAMGASSALFQPIVFTHHRSVVEAARNVLGERADILFL